MLNDNASRKDKKSNIIPRNRIFIKKGEAWSLRQASPSQNI